MMGLSKTNRILILLVIDTAFFLLELIVGMSAYVAWWYCSNSSQDMPSILSP
jgi:phage shock protein PspC (stress-responsive transcriptional regulator)